MPTALGQQGVNDKSSILFVFYNKTPMFTVADFPTPNSHDLKDKHAWAWQH